MGTAVKSLADLAQRLAIERRRAIDELLSVPDSTSFPDDLLAKVDQLQSVSLAVQAEIASHTPKVGYGAESWISFRAPRGRGVAPRAAELPL